MNINKASLLGHSRVFNEMVKEKKIGNSSKFLIDNDQEVYSHSWKLIDCLTWKPMSVNELNEKMETISRWIWDLKGKIEDLTEDLEHNPVGFDAVGMGYV